MFLMVCVAIILGTIFGALPGVSATMAVALGLTFYLHDGADSGHRLPDGDLLLVHHGRLDHRDSVQDSGRSLFRADDV